MAKILFALMSVVIGLIAMGGVAIYSVSTYDEQPASDKFDQISKNVYADTSSAAWPSTLAMAKLFLESMDPTIHYVSDEFPSGRSKLIHSVGSIAAIRWDMEAAPKNNYTGLFSSGVTYGFARLSSAQKFDTSKAAGDSNNNFIPGIGLKLLRDGVPSANFFVMHTLTPQLSWNFFKNALSIHVSPNNLSFGAKLVAKKFEGASAWAAFVGLSDVARYAADGTQTPDSNIRFPYQLLFYPNPDVQARFPDEFDQDMFTQLATIPSGTHLYDIYAMDAPFAPPQYIGKMTTTSGFTTSKYGDSTLFLKHQTFDEDLSLRSEWLKPCADVYACPVCPVDINC